MKITLRLERKTRSGLPGISPAWSPYLYPSLCTRLRTVSSTLVFFPRTRDIRSLRALLLRVSAIFRGPRLQGDAAIVRQSRPPCSFKRRHLLTRPKLTAGDGMVAQYCTYTQYMFQTSRGEFSLYPHR